MAEVNTTLASACGIQDQSIRVTSATSFAKGQYVKVDNEQMLINGDPDGVNIPVQRGVGGSINAAHVSGANCLTYTLASDSGVPVSQLAEPITLSNQWRLPYFSYSASGALTAAPGIHVLNGSGALTMTLTDPTYQMEGQVMLIAGNGSAAHTVSLAAASSSFGNAGSDNDVATFGTGGRQVMFLVAVNAKWCPISLLAGSNIADLTVTLA